MNVRALVPFVGSTQAPFWRGCKNRGSRGNVCNGPMDFSNGVKVTAALSQLARRGLELSIMARMLMDTPKTPRIRLGGHK